MNNVTQLSHQALIDYTYAGMSEIMNDMMKKRQLTASDMEVILEKLNGDIQKRKAIDYSSAVVELTAKIQQMEKEKHENEEVQSTDKTV